MEAYTSDLSHSFIQYNLGEIREKETWYQMSKNVVRIAVPTILGQVFALLVVAINTAFVGHTGDSAKLAGVGLGTLYVNIFCQSIILGLNGAVATLVSQAYGGGNLRKCGIYLNRGRVVAIIAFMPILIALLLCEDFMVAIGMDKRASYYAGIYTYLLIPAMFFHSQFDATRQYLNALNKAHIVMYVMVLTSALHLVWCSLLTQYWTLDVVGVSLATLITYFLNFALITIYSRYDKDVRKSFFFFTKESFEDLGDYLRIGVPSCCMLCLEWWSFEVLALMAGYISVDATGAHVIILNTHVVVIMVPLGAQVATIVCVGTAMGEGLAKKASQYFKLIALYSFLLNLTLGIVIFFTRELLAKVFTSAQNLLPLIEEGYIVMILILLIHGFAMVQAGAVRGLGKLSMATGMVFFAFYVVSLPCAYLFAFTLKMGMVGLWWGVVAGSISEVILYFIFLRYWCNWKRLALEISDKMRSKNVSPNISFKRADLMEPMLGTNYQQNHHQKRKESN